MSAPGPQKWNSGNSPSAALQLVAQLGRMGVDVGSLRPSAGYIGPRRDRPVRRRVHVVPPEQLGAGERRVAPCAPPPTASRPPPAGSIAATARPRPDRGSTSRWPRCRARAAATPVTKRRLHGGGNRRRNRCSARRPPRATRAAAGSVRAAEQCRRQADDVEDQSGMHSLPDRSPRFSAAPLMGAGVRREGARVSTARHARRLSRTQQSAGALASPDRLLLVCCLLSLIQQGAEGRPRRSRSSSAQSAPLLWRPQSN